MIPDTDRASPFTTMAGRSDRDGHLIGVEVREGGGRAEEGTGAGVH